jgi:hypothetical protein
MVGLIASAARFGQSLGIENRWYLFLAGFFILIEVPIHVRHASNIVRFSLLGNSEAAAGRVTYVRWFVLRVSSVDFFSFAVLFLLGYAATGSWFILGGSIRCVAFGLFQLLLSWKARRKPVAVLE